ncbi:MAG TPA: hypothetical protein VFR01_08090 [Geobacterales bacterium]|nr:hypothetical protein [Geobacterales bacterium]
MPNCELLATCLFFNDKMKNMPVSANLMKTVYCMGDNGKCARYRIYKELGRDHVPPDLYPAQESVCKVS